jgi:hypothetical protein
MMMGKIMETKTHDIVHHHFAEPDLAIAGPTRRAEALWRKKESDGESVALMNRSLRRE